MPLSTETVQFIDWVMWINIFFIFVFCCNLSVSQLIDGDQAKILWNRFQKFSRSYEMSSTQCAALDLDTPLSHLSDIDTSTSKNGNKIRVLYLATIRSLFMMTDRWIFHTYMALTNTNEYEVILWGIGMPGFHLNETTKQNIQRWFVDPLFDIVITSWPYHTTSKGRVDSDVERDMYGHRGDDFVGLPGSPIISTIVHELSWQGYERLIRPNIVFVVYNQFLGINVTVDSCGRIQSASSADGSNSGMCQLNPYLETLVGACPVGDRCSQNRTRTMLAYMPHGIYHPLYHPYANITSQEKVHNVLLIGAVHRFIYPLRHTGRWRLLVTKGHFVAIRLLFLLFGCNSEYSTICTIHMISHLIALLINIPSISSTSNASNKID